jgi:hypothetical protein
MQTRYRLPAPSQQPPAAGRLYHSQPVRRALFVALVGLVITPLAQAGTTRASIAVSPSVLSPRTGAVEINASLPGRAPLGLQVVQKGGALLGWLAPETERTTLRFTWHGRLGGRRLPDGEYVLQLVSGTKPLARTRFRIDTTAPRVTRLRVGDGGRPYAGDWRLLATVTPNGDGVRDSSVITFNLSEPATVQFEVNTTKLKRPFPVLEERFDLPAGPNTIGWTPSPKLGPRTYFIHLTVTDAAGNRRQMGVMNPHGKGIPGPVVRVQGVDAAFGRASYLPGTTAVLRVATDTSSFSVQLFHAGPETVVTSADNVMNGVPVGPSTTIDWSAHRDAPDTVRLWIPDVPSGIYFARLTAADGRIGFAPLIVRPRMLGEHRIAVVIPTNTWQAYNFYDANGNGWGDTWYAGGPSQVVMLDRPFLRRGVPPFFRRYDLPFQHWLVEHGIQVDTITDDELETSTGAGLASAYDLIVFPGHHEYVTDREMDAVTGFRDRGGNLIFLSANNFFWRVERSGTTIRRTQQWRKLGRPEAAVIGAQYRANDEGERQEPFIVGDTTAAPWLWAGTGLTSGSRLGADIGGYGTEIDGTAPSSPPGTIVLAEVPDLFGPGLTAQMTYYETPAGAKVFAAGTLDFGGSVMHEPQDRLLQNLWARLSQP